MVELVLHVAVAEVLAAWAVLATATDAQESAHVAAMDPMTLRTWAIHTPGDVLGLDERFPDSTASTIPGLPPTRLGVQLPPRAQNEGPGHPSRAFEVAALWAS